MTGQQDLRQKVSARLAKLFEDHDQWSEKECERYLELEAQYPQETAEDARTMVWLISKAYLKSNDLIRKGKVEWDGYALKLGNAKVSEHCGTGRGGDSGRR